MKISQIKDKILQNLQKNKERNVLPPLQEKYRYEKKEKLEERTRKKKHIDMQKEKSLEEMLKLMGIYFITGKK